ncbi:MAG: hypothetical protein KKA52_02820 [Candidatus Omnitrophica bacterium]|nr:hypothetical protein [Candidatus Omnitrophota bacterium]
MLNAQITPSFIRNPANNELTIDWAALDLSPTPPVLTLYAIKYILRGVLLGLRFIEVGDFNRNKIFLAVAVFSYYTASFHFIQALFALNGRVIIKPTNIQSAELGLTNSLIMAKLTRENNWVFEGLSQSHGAIWKNLDVILAGMSEEALKPFLQFFYYVLASEMLPPNGQDELIRKGIEKLSQIRHEAIYEGYGFDEFFFLEDFAVEEGEDKSPIKNLKNKAVAYKLFSRELLKLCLNDVFELKKVSLDEHWGKIKDLITFSILIPPFEQGRPDLSDDLELDAQVKNLLFWLGII